MMMGHEWAPKDMKEQRRQARVLTSGVFGMRGDKELTQIVEKAALAAKFPFAAVSIVDRRRLWLAVAYGFDPREFDRPDSFCDAAIKAPGCIPLCVGDAWQEPRFSFAPAVLEMGVRSYYAAPLVTRDGFSLGTLCLLDQQPRHDMDEDRLASLIASAHAAVAVIERAPNAIAYSDIAIEELCSRIGYAVANEDEALVAVLDDELRRLELQVGRSWR